MKIIFRQTAAARVEYHGLVARFKVHIPAGVNAIDNLG